MQRLYTQRPRPRAQRKKMNEDFNITDLVEKYEQMRALGKHIYFDADEFAVLAEYYNMHGDNEEAHVLITEGLKMHPGSPHLMVLKAKTLVFSEQYTQALEYIKQIPDDGDIDVPLIRIESLLHLNRFPEADKIIKQTLDEDLPEDDLYIFIIETGFLLNDVDMFDYAIHFLEESMKIDDANPDVLIDLAYAYEMKGIFSRAIELNNRLLDIDPYSFDGWVNIGKLYSMNGEYDKAIDSFDFALTINDNDIPVLKMKALSLYLNDNVEEAIRIFEQCLQEAPNDESLYDSLLEAYEAMEEYDEMMKIIDKKEEIFGPKNILAKRAFVYINKEELTKSKELFHQIPDDEKDSLDYYMLEGELAFYDGDFVRSEAAYMKAALISEGNEDILDRLANINVAQEKYEKAAEYLEELYEIAPDFPTVKSRLAFIRFEIGAKEPFDKIMEEFSDDELRELLNLITGNENADFSKLGRENILRRLNEARENRVLFKNIKY